MLVLTRRLGESLVIDENVKITILDVQGRQVRIGIDAPRSTAIRREELLCSVRRQNRAAASSRPFPDVKKVARPTRAS